MAFLQLDDFGDLFINIDGSVGGQSDGKKKPNLPNDVLVVQAILEIVYNNGTKFKKRRPGNQTIPAPTSTLQQVTPVLIADFQRNELKRTGPQGFCNQAPGARSGQLQFNTLFRLYRVAESIDSGSGLGDKNLLARLQREHPSLRGLPQRVRPTVIKASEEENLNVGPRKYIDSSQGERRR